MKIYELKILFENQAVFFKKRNKKYRKGGGNQKQDGNIVWHQFPYKDIG